MPDADDAPAAGLSIVDAYNLAAGTYHSGNVAAAITLCETIRRQVPDHPDTTHLLGVILLQLGRPVEAESLIAAALRRKRTPTMLANHAAALSMLGRSAEALEAHRAAIAAEPGNANWHYGLATTLNQLGRTGEALEAYAAAVAAAPEQVRAHDARGRILFGQRRLAEAEAAFRIACAVEPDRAESMTGLGVTLSHLGRPEEGYAIHRRALRLDPSRLDDAVHSLDFARARLRFDLIEEARADVVCALEKNLSGVEWRLLSSVLYRDLYRPLPDGLRRRTEAELNARLAGFASPPPPAVRRKDGRLRIGYLSGHLKDHPIGHVTLSLFAAHDRHAVEVLGFLRSGTDPARDAYAARHRRGFDEVHDLSVFTPAVAADYIRATGVDVLIYLDGHMDKDGLEIMTRRPAPVRVYWLGHARGIGPAATDYLLADRIVVPPGEEGLYGEKVVRLPDCYHCADRHAIAEVPPTRADQNLPDDAFVFCGFNNVEKIDFAAFRHWAEILRQVDRSVLWLSGGGGAAANLRRFAAELGVDPARIVFAERIGDKSLHLARYRLADLFLDTWTMNASTTALDALWAGVPLVAMAGDGFSNRISNSMLAAVGMSELVCPDPRAYTTLAVALALNPALLASLRGRLRANLDTTPLFDITRFAAKLEAAYRRMHERRLEGLEPEGFDL